MTTLTASVSSSAASARPAWRSIGFWLAVVLIAYSAFNVFRSAVAPAEFAITYGLPVPDSLAFVTVYTLRTLFITLFAAGLLAFRRYGLLASYALLATVMSVGDALLVASYGASIGTIARHLFVTAFLVVTWFFLRRLAQSQANK